MEEKHVMHREEVSIFVGGKELRFETGRFARQANGAVVVRCGDTVVFCTACASPEAEPEVDFLPFRVDVQKKLSSAGKTPGGFIKREGRPTESEILASRLIDRPLRPLFPKGYTHEVQVLAYVWSYDGVHATDALAICGASAALVLSDIPFTKPVGAVQVGWLDGQCVINPTVEQQKKSKLDLMLAGTEDAILMIEGSADFLSEEEVLQAIEAGHVAIQEICREMDAWRKKVGKAKKTPALHLLPEGLEEIVQQLAQEPLKKALHIPGKLERDAALDAVDASVKASLLSDSVAVSYKESQVSAALKELRASLMRWMILDENKRADGRTCEQIRPITIEQGLLPRTHGSSLFTRGETQALAVCTLGGSAMAQRFEDLDGEGAQRFYLQYFFPPFSVGEVGKMGAPGRREVGHGKLAERALLPLLPSQEKFPYTVRLESNILESNGSSSMATVCGGCLALMDAGVPIQRPVAGIAMGLILEGKRFAILSDILGMEDALGDMDFKVAGDAQGITAFQMDIKVEGITLEIMRVALQRAKEGLLHILRKMLVACPEHKREMSQYAPRIETVQIKPSKIAAVIGPGGKQIRAIIEKTGAQIDINDEGVVSISASDTRRIEEAKAMVRSLTDEVEIGKIYSGQVTSVVAFGVFVQLLPGKEGLCHISEFDVGRIDNLADHVKPGDMISVKVLDITELGKIKLSRKAALSEQNQREIKGG